MSNFYSDRAVATLAGVVLDDYQISNITWDVDLGVDFVDTMSKNFQAGGYVRKNLKVTGSFMLKIPTSGGMYTPETLNFQSGAYSLIVDSVATVYQGNSNQFDGMSWIFSDVAIDRVSGGFQSPGTEGGMTYSFKALGYMAVVPPGAITQ